MSDVLPLGRTLRKVNWADSKPGGPTATHPPQGIFGEEGKGKEDGDGSSPPLRNSFMSDAVDAQSFQEIQQISQKRGREIHCVLLN